MSTSKSLNDLREELWSKHPLVLADAHVSTAPLLKAYKRIKWCARRSRSSIAFWAFPLTGKSFAIEVIIQLLRRDYPECAIVSYEADSKSKNRVPNKNTKEQVWAPTSLGGFLRSLLDEIAYEPRRERTNDGQKRQLNSALYALAADSGRIFLIVDEAQELIEAEYCWLKKIINALIKKRVIVTIILFGQKELKDRRNILKSECRSDLFVRFAQSLYSYEGITCVEDLRDFLAQCDVNSEYPEGSGLTYTHFLWPRAFENGFRLADCAEDLWNALTAIVPLGASQKGIAMHWVAHAVAEFADITKNKDGPQFKTSASLWSKAVRATDFSRQDVAA